MPAPRVSETRAALRSTIPVTTMSTTVTPSIIVASALIAGVTPKRTAAKITIGHVCVVEPAVKSSSAGQR